MVTGTLPLSPLKRISQEQFDDWRRSFFNQSRHSTNPPHAGHSFCNHFDIDDSVIFHTATPAHVIAAAMERYLVRP